MSGNTLSGGGLTGAIAFEWTKLRSVRSTWFCLLAAAALVSLYTIITGVSIRSPGGTSTSSSVLTSSATGMLFLGQFPLLALAGLVITAEYPARAIYSTLQGVPVRWRMLLAKCLVALPVLTVAGALAGLVGVGVATITMGPYAAAITLPALIAQCVTIGLYLALTGVILIGIGAAVRNLTATLAVAIAVILGIPLACQALGSPILVKAAEFLPGTAGMVLMGLTEIGAYGRMTGGLLLLGWAVAAFAVGYSVLRTRDA